MASLRGGRRDHGELCFMVVIAFGAKGCIYEDYRCYQDYGEFVVGVHYLCYQVWSAYTYLNLSPRVGWGANDFMTVDGYRSP